MKKVKIMLMAIAVVAVTGGLVAAKVNRTTVFCVTSTVTSTTCPCPVFPTMVVGALGSGTHKVCTAALVNNQCPTSCSAYKTTLTTDD